ncbi:MAG: hypothetical protein EPN93_17520 [Spirochaetes bacterium]|nr:MAG: hypothetical protein EPN93_17520 [Spirochaetota bacterium]
MSDYNDILGSDLAEDETGDLAIDIGRGDFRSARGMDCFLADIRLSLVTPPGGIIDAPFEGGLFSREGPLDELRVMEMRRAYEELLQSDPRTKPTTVKITASLVDGKPNFSASFETITDQVIDNFVL